MKEDMVIIKNKRRKLKEGEMGNAVEYVVRDVEEYWREVEKGKNKVEGEVKQRNMVTKRRRARGKEVTKIIEMSKRELWEVLVQMSKGLGVELEKGENVYGRQIEGWSGCPTTVTKEK